MTRLDPETCAGIVKSERWAQRVSADVEPPPEVLAVRHLVEAIVRVLRNHPGIAEAIEADVVAAADVLVREDA